MNPLISIVVPVYNTEKYIAETIDAVIAQTYPHWELILVDDGSTDGSAKIMQAYAEKEARIRYVYKENGGQASARNKGIKEAKGEYISLLDADDLWLENKLSEQIAELESYSPDFLYGLGYYYYPEREKQLEAYDWVSGQMTGETFFKVLYHSCAVNTNTVIVKKSLFDKVGYFDESQILRGTEDWDLWLRIAKVANKIYGSPSRLVYYRIHEGGIHLQHARMLIGKLTIYKKYDQETLVPQLMRKREYRYHYRELMNHLLKDDRANEIDTYFKELKQKDRFGFGTIMQGLIYPLSSKKTFIAISNKVIYRIAYRIEKMAYRLFLGNE